MCVRWMMYQYSNQVSDNWHGPHYYVQYLGTTYLIRKLCINTVVIPHAPSVQVLPPRPEEGRSHPQSLHARKPSRMMLFHTVQ